jgi:hypothetical protein
MHVTRSNRISEPKGIGIPTGTAVAPMAPVVKGLLGYLFPSGYMIRHIEIRAGRLAEPSGR